ncbi:amidohydrolase [Glutamicibacter bergerei]|uniref:amidohydrolase n=1 Tax=Glutamicibacter ardleyensis TaxID=225894 RepID=UPI003FD1D5C9
MLSTALTEDETRTLHENYLHLHAHPELSMAEYKTAQYIQERLNELGIENFISGGTGVVGIQRNGDGPVIAFRADSDGLPMKEDTGADYASVDTGVLADGTQVPVMHGCGHDTHVASALSAAQVLARDTENWSGTVLWIFQPGEETAAGARAMLSDGLWQKVPHPQVVLGQHVFPFQTGSIAVTEGSAMALADSLKVTLYGKQSHGSQPQDSVDPIVLGAHIITRLQTIVSRELHPLSPAVITCGTFHAGLKENIIPDRAEFTLNIRTLTEEVRAQVLAAVTRIINAEAVAANAQAPLIEELYNFPRLYNDPEQTQSVATAFGQEFGASQVRFSPPAMGSEDFGALADALDVPNVFWMFGGFDLSAGPAPVNHSPHFLPDYIPALDTAVRAALTAIGYYVAKKS